MDLSSFDFIVVAICYVTGFLFALRSLFVPRSPQASVAWVLGLLFFPIGAVPFYVFFGARKFQSYRKLKRTNAQSQALKIQKFHLPETLVHNDAQLQVLAELYGRLSKMRLMKAENVRVYIHGVEFYEGLRKAIESAQSYVFLEFFIIENDSVGLSLKDLLIRKAREGVRVYCIYDHIGSSSLPSEFLSEMTQAGVHVQAFSLRSWVSRLQLNFRNHRKIVVVDGREALVGGFNIGENYLSGGEKFRSWRDTHVHFTGSAVQGVQYTFLEDYYSCGVEISVMDWLPKLDSVEEAPKEAPALVQVTSPALVQVLPTGPADVFDRASVFVQSLIHQAKHRLWISTPYFVVDETVMSALKVAALKGVDVRLLLPSKADHLFVHLAADPLIKELVEVGVKIFRYTKGFNHQKTWVVDSNVGVIGTMNLDNRSIHLNFELSLIFFDESINQKLASDFMVDTEGLLPVTMQDMRRRGFGRKVLAQIAQLFAPLL